MSCVKDSDERRGGLRGVERRGCVVARKAQRFRSNQVPSR